ncbi:hypothetical protein ABE61_09625 [Lysinibacillus sphaericus]|uniref:hypothetical protein n=1 Tax=Lysinibacillus sphaericus TaxID=1421 RepID=UPI0018CF0779|nr:hypothetical protein [Lysinibacillus sphaericus]MBG9454311.1 hypothetical protein [Lysinibacillus sphaericus]MBG9476443.1 hypothetical protein [Lysinibacillus sphaericus]MBG9591229.1 hypothetical protein [Lysinibacillus sphaericus]
MIVFSLGFLFKIICLLGSLTVIQIFSKKRDHKDFKKVIITSGFVFLVSLMLAVISSLDSIALLSRNLKESEGICQVYVPEPTAKGSEGLEIVIGDLSLSGGVNDFPYIKEGTYQCHVKYLPYSKIVIEFAKE